MDAFILTLVKLVVYPLVLVGLIELFARAREYFACNKCLKLTDACKQRCAALVVVGAFVWAISRGFDGNINGICDVLTVAAFVIAIYLGYKELKHHKRALQHWFDRKLGRDCDC